MLIKNPVHTLSSHMKIINFYIMFCLVEAYFVLGFHKGNTQCKEKTANNFKCKCTHLLLNLGSNEVSGLLHSGDLLCTFLIQLDVEFLFKSHHDFDGVKGISAQVNKFGFGSNLKGK